MIQLTIKKLINKIGIKTKKKYLLFVSDDWGCKRLKSQNTRNFLQNIGLEISTNRFDTYDCLETNIDVESIFDILLKYKDNKGNHPVITAATIVANPDFLKIKENNFQEYFYESIDKTLADNPYSDKVLNYYKEGIRQNIFVPESHGREHLQVNWWMNLLRSNNEIVKKAFDQEFFMLGGKYLPNNSLHGLGAAFDLSDISETKQQLNIIEDGLTIFHNIFGYEAKYFTAPAQQFNPLLENALHEKKISLIDVPMHRKIPVGNGKYKTKFHFQGQKNKLGQRYLIRNAVFEPNQYENDDGVDSCLNQILIAFNNHQPAVISNHRASFVGHIDEKNRDKGLKAFEKLLNSILKKWPDVEFISVRDLGSVVST